MGQMSSSRGQRLREIPLSEVIPRAFPGAQLSRERQGPGRVRWILPDGTKVNVLPLATGDIFRFMNRLDWERPDISCKGAINFLILARQNSYAEATHFLEILRYDASHMPRQRPQQPPLTPLQHPPRAGQGDAVWTQVADYLQTTRQLPTWLIHEGARRGVFYAGDGVYRGYVVFPHKETRGSDATGYSLRWVRSGAPPHHKPTKWVAPGSRLKDGWFTLGTAQDRLVIVESPIDAMTLWASAIREGIAHRLTVRASSGAGGLHETMWQGFDQVVAAMDCDAAGQRYSQWIAAHHPQAIRLLPPGGHKDWNAAWQAGARDLLEPLHLWEWERARMVDDHDR